MTESQQAAPEAQAFNPWFSMWTRPRETIRRIVGEDPEHLVLFLACASGFGQTLDRAALRGAGDELYWPTIFLLAAIFGPIGGLIGLYLGGFLLRVTGRWIGGRASGQFIRAAVAWSNVPVVWALLLWIPLLALFGGEVFSSEGPHLEDRPGHAAAYALIGLLEVGIGAWVFVLLLKSLGEVQGFSAWRALGNVLLALLLVIVPVLAVAFAIRGFSA